MSSCWHSCFAHLAEFAFEENDAIHIAIATFLNIFSRGFSIQNKSKIIRCDVKTPVSYVWHYIKSLLLLVFLSRLASHAGSPV